MDPLKQPGIVLNIDTEDYRKHYLRIASLPHPTEEDFYPLVDVYANTQITDLCIDVFAQLSFSPSAIWTDPIAKAAMTIENGFPVSYEEQWGGVADLYTVHKLNIFHIWFKRCRELGLRCWLTLRMNDCHDPDAATSWLRGDFFYEAREKGWMIGDDFGYWRYCYNYAVPEVREIMLAYITEQLRQYPEADGLELDFSREFYCFARKDLPQAPAIMNDFISQVHTIVKQAEKECGHDIPVMIRVPRDLSTAMDLGFDVVRWAEEGWCDVVVPTPRFSSTDSDMPIDQWKEQLPGLPIYAGIETRVFRATSEESRALLPTVKGYAHEYFSLGADKINLYNYYMLSGFNHKALARPLIDPSKCVRMENTARVYPVCGHPETAKQGPRRFVVTFQDVAIKEETRYKPLPMAVPTGENASITIATGKSETPSKLLVGLDAGAPIPQVVCNGEPCAYLGEDTRENPYPHPGTRLFLFELPVFTEVRQTLSFTSPDGDTSITYLEVETENN